MDVTTPRVQFGPFVLDLGSGDLVRDGVRRPLQDQSLILLKALLEHPGELVRRETLVRLLWADGTNVDFEHGLNAAIKRLRDTLDDNADVPVFIQTVPRRGYRFTASVTALGEREPRPLGPARWKMGAALMATVVATAAAVLVLRPPHERRVEAAGVSAPAPPSPLDHVTYDAGWSTDPAISADGQLLAYASDRAGGNLNLWLQNLDGSAAKQLTHDTTNAHEPAVAPDNSRLAFRSERDGGGLYTMPVYTGGRAELLVAGGHHPQYSPDGRWIAYWTGGIDPDVCYPSASNRVYVVPAEGGSPIAVAPGLIGGCWPIWAPDSKHLLVTAQLTPNADFAWLVVSLDDRPPVDTGLAELAAHSGFGCPPRQLSWVGTRLVFSVFREGPRNLWAAHIDPTDWHVGNSVEHVTISAEDQPVGRMALNGRLVLASLTNRVQLWTLPITADGSARGRPEQMTPGVHFDRYPTMSENGRTLTMARVFGENNAVYVRTAAGVEQERVHGQPGIGLPVISPDGSRIAYPMARDNRSTIQVVGVAAGDPEQITADCGQCVVTGWSHDGGRLLYIDDRRPDTSIMAFDFATGRRQLLAHENGAGLWEARFSPDDRWLTFLEAKGDDIVIRVAPVPSSGDLDPATWVSAIGASNAFDDKPRWSHDGARLYFISNRDGFKCIWTQRLDARTKRPVGPPSAVLHLHDAARSLSTILTPNLGMDVGTDRLIFNMAERTGNVYTTQLDANAIRESR